MSRSDIREFIFPLSNGPIVEMIYHANDENIYTVERLIRNDNAPAASGTSARVASISSTTKMTIHVFDGNNLIISNTLKDVTFILEGNANLRFTSDNEYMIELKNVDIVASKDSSIYIGKTVTGDLSITGTPDITDETEYNIDVYARETEHCNYEHINSTADISENLNLAGGFFCNDGSLARASDLDADFSVDHDSPLTGAGAPAGIFED